MSFITFWRRQSAQLSERGIHIKQLHRTLSHRLRGAWHGNDQRHAQRNVPKRVGLGPLPLLTQVIAMIAPEDDDGVVSQTKPIQSAQYTTYLLINKTG